MRKHLFILLISFFLPFAKGAPGFFAQSISVNSTGAANSSLSMFEVLQTSNVANTKGLHISHSGGIAGTGYGFWSEKTGASTTNIAGYFSASGGTSNYPGIFMGGNVGVGTTTPTSLLNISGVHGTTQARLTLPAAANGLGTGDVNLQLWVSEPGVTWDAAGIGTNVTNNGAAPAGFGRINTALGQSYIRFVTNGGAMAFNTTDNAGTYYQTMYMTGGNVGVGTTGPISRFHSTGNMTVGAGTTAGSIGNAQITTGGASPISNRLTYGTDGTGWKFAIAKNQGGVVTEQMTIQDNGYVGIGTTTPAYTLDLNSGTLGYGVTSSRTEYRADAGLQGSAGAQSGFFQTATPAPSADWPVSTANATPGFDASGNATSWWHLIDSRHSNTANNYALQISGSFFDQKLFFRKTNGSANTAWSEILTTSSTGIATPKSQVFLTNGTFNVTAGTSVMVTMCGGGGGGGGGGSGGTTQNSGGGGGGGAECYNSYLIAVRNTEVWTITVGAAGTAGALNTNGGAGGTTSIVGSVSGTILTASGGAGGTRGFANSTNNGASGGSGGNGGGGGAGAGGAGGGWNGAAWEAPYAGGSVTASCNYSPGAGGGGGYYNNNYGNAGASGGNVVPKLGGSTNNFYYGGGCGGASLFGTGGVGAGSNNAAYVATAGSGYGSGGGGGCGAGGAYGGTSKVGAAGAPGIVTIYY